MGGAMQNRPRILLLADDDTLAAEARATLSGAGYTVQTERVLTGERTLVVRDWRDDGWFEGGSAPELTVDLSILQGERLLDTIERALGLSPRQGFASHALLEDVSRTIDRSSTPDTVPY
jgi:hypothetical protein